MHEYRRYIRVFTQIDVQILIIDILRDLDPADWAAG